MTALRSALATPVTDAGPLNRLGEDMAYAFDGLAAPRQRANDAAAREAGLGDVLRELDGPAASCHDLARQRR